MGEISSGLWNLLLDVFALCAKTKDSHRQPSGGYFCDDHLPLRCVPRRTICNLLMAVPFPMQLQFSARMAIRDLQRCVLDWDTVKSFLELYWTEVMPMGRYHSGWRRSERS
jgi:hypothetical protein